jgi:hypothetical protein
MCECWYVIATFGTEGASVMQQLLADLYIFFFIFCVLLPVPWEEKLMMPIVLFNSCCRYDTHFPSSGTDSVEVDYYNLMMFSKEHIQKK